MTAGGRLRTIFDIHDEVTQSATIADADLIPFSDEGSAGDPMRFTTAEDFAEYSADRICTGTPAATDVCRGDGTWGVVPIGFDRATDWSELHIWDICLGRYELSTVCGCSNPKVRGSAENGWDIGNRNSSTSLSKQFTLSRLLMVTSAHRPVVNYDHRPLGKATQGFNTRYW